MDMPLLVTRGLVALPGVMLPLDVGREASIQAVQAARRGEGRLVLALESDDGCHRVGTLCELVRVSAVAGGRLRIMLRTLSGCRIDEVSDGVAVVAPLAAGPEASVAEREALCAHMKAYVERHPGLDDSAGKLFADAEAPSVLLTGLAAQIARFDAEVLQALLASPVATRVLWLTEELASRVGQLPGMGERQIPAPEDALGPLPEGLDDGMAWTARIYLRTGLLPHEEVVAVTVDAWRGPWRTTHGDVNGLEDAAQQLVHRLLLEEGERARTFPEITACDRLEAALDTLTDQGLVTGLLGVDLADALATADRTSPGAPYAVFHQQDLIDAVQGEGLAIAFGGPRPLEVGRQVAAALEAEGLTVIWPERADVRIHVAMRWEHRLVEARSAA